MMRSILSLFLILCVLGTALPLSGCDASWGSGDESDMTNDLQRFSEYDFNCFDTVTTITGYAETKEDFDHVASVALAELKEYHQLYTIYHRFEGMENLCTINELVNMPTDSDQQNAKVHRTVTVDRRIIDMLLYAKEMYAKTNGRVNIAMGSVLSIWHDYRTLGMDDPVSAELPPMDKLLEAAQHTDINCLVIDEINSTVHITDPCMTLDVGAVAKGYAVEMVARSMEEKGVTGYVLNVGGNVRTIGSKPDGASWVVGIENPTGSNTEPYLAYMSLSGQSLVTSGSYQRYYIVEGKRYHHIIDPDTLMPQDLYLSVSVVCQSSADGDALSTALFCMSPADGLALVESLPGIEAHWLLNDGTRQTSSGFNQYVSK